jgi:hypothetical protein
MSHRLAIAIGAAIILLVAAFFINRATTGWVEDPGFRETLDRSTSKGLKLKADYGALHRVGVFGLSTDTFSGTDGQKTIVTLDAHDVTGTFNPLGMILRYWEIDNLHIKSGSVMLQKTETAPGASKSAPWPPWWGMFWPYRVYLEDVKCDSANILWKLKDQESGIYGTFLEITPNWKDFEYDARGGELKTPMTPTLNVQHAHLLIRRPRLYCSELILGDDPAHPEQQLRLTGDAGLQDDRSMNLKMDWTGLQVAPWLPVKMRPHVVGQMEGNFGYTSKGTGLETGKGQGKVVISGGVLRGMPFVKKYASITGSPDPGDLNLKVCRADVKWDAGAITAENMEIESEGVFRLTGTMTITADKQLQGQIELGLTDPYLNWLPTAKSAIFTRSEGPYHFTTVHFSGTAQKPEQDLAPRVTQEVKKNPMVALKVFFNSIGDWFDTD